MRGRGRHGRWLGLAVLVTLSLAQVSEGHARRVLAKIKGKYSRIEVYEERGLRCFKFSGPGDSIQSCMNLKDPLKARFEYIRMMFAAGTTVPRHGRVLALGLGGGTLIKLTQQYYPEATMDVVELEPAVVKMARKYFRFTPSARTTVHVMDAYDFVLRKAKQKYDLIYMDCFGEDFIPPRLRSLRFIEGLRALLNPGGRVVTNVYEHPAYAGVLQRYQKTFPGMWLMKGKKSLNLILISSTGKGGATWRAFIKHARAERRRMKVPFALGVHFKRLTPLPALTNASTGQKDPKKSNGSTPPSR